MHTIDLSFFSFFTSNYKPDYKEIMFSIYLIALIIQIFYYLFFYIRIFSSKKIDNHTQKPISVIITAKNEAPNLEKYLPRILEQNYSDFEVIVVNDASSDESSSVLERIKAKYQNLYVTTIPYDERFSHGKKLALNVGFKAAKKEWLVFTDADCVPKSSDWLCELSKAFDKDAEIVLGYGAYMRGKGILNKIIRYDTLSIAIQYFTFALSGVPYMGVGRNMAVKKTALERVKRHHIHMDVLSGSDDLLINELANKKNTRIVLNPQSFTYSEPEKKFKYWWRQKKRHLSSAKYYKLSHKILLFFEPFSRLIFYSLFILLILMNMYLPYILIPFILRFLIQLIIWIKSSLHFKEKDLLTVWFLFDTFVYIIIGINSFFSIFKRNKVQWK